jgi:hypothetical protein
MRGHIRKRYKDSWNIILDIGYQVDPTTFLKSTTNAAQHWQICHSDGQFPINLAPVKNLLTSTIRLGGLKMQPGFEGVIVYESCPRFRNP